MGGGGTTARGCLARPRGPALGTHITMPVVSPKMALLRRKGRLRVGAAGRATAPYADATRRPCTWTGERRRHSLETKLMDGRTVTHGQDTSPRGVHPGLRPTHPPIRIARIAHTTHGWTQKKAASALLGSHPLLPSRFRGLNTQHTGWIQGHQLALYASERRRPNLSHSVWEGARRSTEEGQSPKPRWAEVTVYSCSIRFRRAPGKGFPCNGCFSSKMALEIALIQTRIGRSAQKSCPVRAYALTLF